MQRDWKTADKGIRHPLLVLSKNVTEVTVQAGSLVILKDLALCPTLRRARKTCFPQAHKSVNCFFDIRPGSRNFT